VDKFTFHLKGPTQRNTIPVTRIYLLEFGELILSESVPALSSVVWLSTHSFIKRRGTEPDALRSHVRDCVAVASAMPLYRLVRPKTFAVLPDLVRAVERDLESDVISGN
jgi:hypothetical protein